MCVTLVQVVSRVTAQMRQCVRPKTTSKTIYASLAQVDLLVTGRMPPNVPSRTTLLRMFVRLALRVLLAMATKRLNARHDDTPTAKFLSTAGDTSTTIFVRFARMVSLVTARMPPNVPGRTTLTTTSARLALRVTLVTARVPPCVRRVD